MTRDLFKEYSFSNRLQETSLKPSIYALCDWELLKKKNISFEKFIQICKRFDVKLIQYRDKINSVEIQKKNLCFLKENLNVPIIINDKIELIQFADGLHLGQEDLDSIVKNNKELSVKLIRKKIGNKILGISTHNEMEILEANHLDLDYIGLGAYRTTTTKDVENKLGHTLSYLAKISNYPVCAIGGVKMNDRIENTTYNVIGSGLYDDMEHLHAKN